MVFAPKFLGFTNWALVRPAALCGAFGGGVYGGPARRKSSYTVYTLCWSFFRDVFLGDGDRKQMVGRTFFCRDGNPW